VIGLGGSGLDVKLTKSPDEPEPYCYKSHDWYRLWLALGSMLPGEIDCWYHNLGVTYNANNDTYSNAHGASIRPIDFGGVKGIDYLDTFLGSGIAATAYYAPLIKDLEAVGYVVGKTLRGAPFDWRVARNPDNLYQKLQALVEEMYTQNGGKRVHIIGHSMGTIHTGEFLNEMTQAWKDKFISSFISIAGPWSGSPQALRAVISGDTFGLKLGDWLNIVDPLRVRKVVRQAGGPIWMLPDVEFWNTTVLVTTPSREYTVADFPQLFDDLGTSITNTIYQKISGVQSEIEAPGVELHCLVRFLLSAL
jgi:lysophospholipase-3